MSSCWNVSSRAATSRRSRPSSAGMARWSWGSAVASCVDHHDAEDAFQSAFLVLARKAGSVRPGEMLPNWLYGVAHQVVRKAQAINTRRRSARATSDGDAGAQLVPEIPGDDLRGLLDRELNRLPPKYRVPVILCDLEGLGHQEAALRLGWPIGTVSGRLSRARALLARRLTRWGLVLSAGSLVLALGDEAASAGVPVPLLRRTIEAAIPSSTRPAVAAGAISGHAAALSNRILGGMMMTKLIATAGACLAGGVLLLGGVAGHRILAGHTVRGVSRPVVRAVVEDAASTEAKLFQGTWQGVEMEMSGKKAPPFERKTCSWSSRAMRWS